MKPRKAAIKLVWCLTIFLACIGVAVVIRRSLILYTGPGTGYSGELDLGFTRHPRLSRTPTVHRWIGRIFVGLGVVIGFSAFGLSFQLRLGA